MFYLLEWVVLIVLTLLVSFAAFFWALRNGQFDDQKRAAYLPLRDLPPDSETHRPARKIAELYVLSFGGAMILVAIFMAFWVSATAP